MAFPVLSWGCGQAVGRTPCGRGRLAICAGRRGNGPAGIIRGVQPVLFIVLLFIIKE
jgi:hypothetical protein